VQFFDLQCSLKYICLFDTKCVKLKSNKKQFYWHISHMLRNQQGTFWGHPVTYQNKMENNNNNIITVIMIISKLITRSQIYTTLNITRLLRKEDTDWVKKCMEYEVEGSRPRGRPKRTWREVMQKDCQARNLNREDAMDCSRWKKLIKTGW